MDKGLLFQFMRVKFREAGFADAEIDLHMQSFTERYQNKTDEEIEADIKRRGGASRIAAATVERRNTVLMADPDYRAFVASAQAADAEQKSTEDDAPSAVPASDSPVLETAAKETPREGEADDPLAQWFAGTADKKADDDALPPLFAEKTENEKPEQPPTADASDTAQIPVVKKTEEPASMTSQTVHTIPLFEESASNDAQTVSAPQAPTGQADKQPSKPPMPPRPNADLGRTKVVQMPQTEQGTKPAPQQKPSNQAYQNEQQAIWASAQGVRDGSTAPARKPAQNANDGTQVVTVRRASSPNGSVQNVRDRAPVQMTSAPKRSTEPKKNVEYADRGNVTWLQEKTYWGEGSEEGVKRFRIILGVSALPVLALLLAYAVLALGLIVLMPILMAAFVLGLVVWVAAGSLVALVAVIYGVSQLFIVVPIGMFELGLGVAAIGITMFVGILMYNIAVRLLPFLLRQFIRFQSVFKGFLQDLYFYVKGECYRR